MGGMGNISILIVLLLIILLRVLFCFHRYFSKLTACGQFSVSLSLSLCLGYDVYLDVWKYELGKTGISDMELFVSFFLFIYILRIVWKTNFPAQKQF